MPRFQTNNYFNELIKRQYNDNIFLPKKIVNNRLRVSHNLYNKNFLAHFGCVNAIEFLNGGQFLASGGDDRRVLLWNVQEAVQGIGSPRAMRSQHVSNIFCLGYDSKNTRLFSAGNDDQVIVHDIQTGEPVDVFLYEQPVYGLSVDPCNDNVFATACDDGRVLICDIRESSSSEPFLLAKCFVSFNSVMYNPVEPRLLATANGKGACLWDVRTPHTPLLKYGNPNKPQSCMSVRWNSAGTQLLALRRRLPPVLYSVDSPNHIAQFDHPGYFNSCTMKSCCFAGYNDEYVLSGSDDFNLYMWKTPPKDTKSVWVSTAHIVLSGHRSIVNQVRFNTDNCLIASSGVEKLIKVWSPFPLPAPANGLDNGPGTDKKREVYSYEEYISLVMRSGQIITHDYSHESTIEDPRMMAFFDSLVQREIEGWSTDETPSRSSPPGYSDRVVSSESSSADTDENYRNCTNTETGPRPNEGRIARVQRTRPNLIVKLIRKKRRQLLRSVRGKNNETNLDSNGGPSEENNHNICSASGDCDVVNTSTMFPTSSENNGENSSTSNNSPVNSHLSDSSKATFSRSSSSNSSSSSSSTSSSSSSDNENCSRTNEANTHSSKTVMRIFKSKKRQRSNNINDYLISSDEEDSYNNGVASNETNGSPKVNCRVKRRALVSFISGDKSNEETKSAGRPLNATSRSHENIIVDNCTSTRSSGTIGPDGSRETNTQDCASFSSLNNSNDKSSSKYSHRNYRKRILESDTD